MMPIIVTNLNWYLLQVDFPNFSIKEMASPDTGVIQVELRFMFELQKLRRIVNTPMIITSGCRTRNYNTGLRGHPRSLHICDEVRHLDQVGTLAVDVAAQGQRRGNLFATAWRLGWSIGWGGSRGFLHLDRRGWIQLPQATFDY